MRKDLLTTAEAAALLGRTPDVLRQWRRRGTGPQGWFRAGSVVLYQRLQLEEWLREHPPGTPPRGRRGRGRSGTTEREHRTRVSGTS